MEIVHVILGNPDNFEMFLCEEDVLRCQEYLRIYKDRLHVEVLAYSFLTKVLHVVLCDHNRQLRRFIAEVGEAYVYFFLLKYQRELRVIHKSQVLKGTKQLMKMIRYMHSRGVNSSKAYENYSRYAPHPLLSIGPVLFTLHSDPLQGKERYQTAMVQELDAAYEIQIQAKELFRYDKMSKRRQRAKTFLDQYLSRQQMSLDEILHPENRRYAKDMVRCFREETDLSFRDIGYVLRLSHTSVIRLLNQ